MQRLVVMVGLMACVSVGAGRSAEGASQPGGSAPLPTQPPGRTPEEPFPQSDHDLLRGPGAEALERLTIVARDSEGRLVRPDASPEEAAIGALRGRLDDETRARVDAILVGRSSAWDAFFRAHVREIVQLQSDLAGGPEGRASAGEAIRGLVEDAPSREDQRVFREALAGALGVAERGEYLRMLEEYRDALLGEVRADAELRGVEVREAMRDEMLRGFGGEIRRAYERETTLGRERLEETLDALALDAAQDGRVRSAITTFGQRRLLGEATEADRLELFRVLADTLTPEQLRTFLELTRGR